MSRLVDHEAVLLDLRSRLLERPSWGSGQVRNLIDELEAEHRIVENADAGVLRRFGDHLTDVFLGELPSSATPDPLPVGDRQTPTAMDDGAAFQSQPMEAPCQPPQSRTARTRSPQTPDFRREESRSLTSAAAAASS